MGLFLSEGRGEGTGGDLLLRRRGEGKEERRREVGKRGGLAPKPKNQTSPMVPIRLRSTVHQQRALSRPVYSFPIHAQAECQDDMPVTHLSTNRSRRRVTTDVHNAVPRRPCRRFTAVYSING